MSEEKKNQSWAEVQIHEGMPLNILIRFMNILNQRLCAIENVVTVSGPTGKMISLTDLYALQAEAEAQAQQTETKQGE